MRVCANRISLTARGIAEVAEDEVSVRLAAESRRKLAAQALHLPLKMLGYLEFSEIYSIDLGRLPPDRPLPGSKFLLLLRPPAP